jgi:hypothetical protein
MVKSRNNNGDCSHPRRLFVARNFPTGERAEAI